MLGYTGMAHEQSYTIISIFQQTCAFRIVESFLFGCQDISVMIEKRKRKFLQKLALSNSVVWTVCQEFVSRDLSYIV